jgi:hypothetical protein
MRVAARSNENLNVRALARDLLCKVAKNRERRNHGQLFSLREGGRERRQQRQRDKRKACASGEHNVIPM